LEKKKFALLVLSVSLFNTRQIFFIAKWDFICNSGIRRMASRWEIETPLGIIMQSMSHSLITVSSHWKLISYILYQII